MATKDWKKDNKVKNIDWWGNKKTGEEISISKASEVTMAKLGYLVLRSDSNDVEYFKTKPEAMRFARNWMKRN